MAIKQIEKMIKDFYNLRANTKIKNLNLYKWTFEITLNSVQLELDVPKQIKREILLDKLLE